MLGGRAPGARRQLTAARPGPAGPLDGSGAGVPRGLRIRREAALARGRESALRVAGRRCDQRRQERRQQMRTLRALAAAGGPLLAPPQRETVGDFVGLCLLIDFPDVPGTIAREEVDRFCNQAGYNGFGNNGSVRDFFLANSIGRCRYSNIVAPYYRAQHPKSHYTNRADPAAAARARADQRGAGSLARAGLRFHAADRRQPGLRRTR